MVSRQSSATSSVPERGSLRRTEDAEPASGGGGGDSWDIFEPRAADVAAAEALQQPPIGAKTDLAALKHMTGAQPAFLQHLQHLVYLNSAEAAMSESHARSMAWRL